MTKATESPHLASIYRLSDLEEQLFILVEELLIFCKNKKGLSKSLCKTTLESKVQLKRELKRRKLTNLHFVPWILSSKDRKAQ